MHLISTKEHCWNRHLKTLFLPTKQIKMTPKFHELTISDVRKETEDTVSVAFEIPDSLKDDYSYLPGQYLTLKAIINGEEVRRSYSLCSSPVESEWRVAIKQVENGKFSTYANNEIKAGMKMDVMTPTGNFRLNPSDGSPRSIVLFAAGSGITPVFSILKTVLDKEPTSTVNLIYGNKGVNSIIFREELEALKNKHMNQLSVLHVLSRESLGNDLQKGRIDTEKAVAIYDKYLKDIAIDDIFICGPEAMIHSVKERNIPESKVHFELFTSPSTKDPVIAKPTNSPKVDSNVTIIIDGDEYDLALESTGQNILDAAQETGADLPFACKGGVCCTCKAKIMEGTASMDVNYALEPDEVEAGYILTCQAHPTSDTLVISFDE